MDILYHILNVEKRAKKHPAIAGWFNLILPLYQEQQKLFYDHSNHV